MKQDKLVLIDGNSIAFRAFFALPLLSNARGIHTNAVYGFAMMLLKILEDEQPTHVLVAFDAGKETFRHELYADYKGTRQKTPGELSEQIPLIHDLLDAFAIRRFELANIEADDIIGTLATQAEAEKLTTLIISGDKDLLQLVDEHTTVLLPRKGITEADRYDRQAVNDKYGLTPQQIVDLKGLMGDASDHIPGIPGVGEKTAIKLLKQFPTVEEVLDHIDDLPGKKLKERVAENREQALMSKQLATIKRDVPVDFTLADCTYAGMDEQAVADLFRKLEFKTLLERVQTEPADDNSAVDDQIDYEIIATDNAAAHEAIFQQEQLALFVETTNPNPHRAEVIGFAFSDGKQHCYVPVEFAKSWTAFREWLTSPDHEKVVYDTKQTHILLSRLFGQASIQNMVFDLHLAGYLLDPSESQLELSDLVSRFQPAHPLVADEIVYGKGAKRQQLEGEPLAAHLARKTRAIFELYPILAQRLQEAKLCELYDEVESPLAAVLAEMEIEGVSVDKARLEELGEVFTGKMERLTADIYQMAGTEFNINSPKQLGEILFDKLGLPVIKKTKTGYSTSADVLEKLAPQHEIVDQILYYRQIGKLLSTYVEGLRKEITPAGKIHTQFQQTVAATGRLSSTEPNLQNIPIRLEEGKQIRQIFIPTNTDHLLLSADYSQIELRVLAHLSEDKALCRAFIEGRDIHTQTAMDLFAVSETEITSLMRRQAKAVNFGIVYGISDFGLSQNLNITRKEAKAIIERYFESYPNVKAYLDSLIVDARKTGYVTTMLGRRRYLPEIGSRNFNRRGFAERTAMNTPIQGTAADLIKLAMVKLSEELNKRKLASRMLLQVHDELIFEVPEQEMDEMKPLVQEMMTTAIPLAIPLQVDMSTGENWYQAK